VPVHLFIDEFQNYIAPSIAEILSESRKFGLHLTMAQQYLGQRMDAEFRRGILANTRRENQLIALLPCGRHKNLRTRPPASRRRPADLLDGNRGGRVSGKRRYANSSLVTNDRPARPRSPMSANS
jgi:hypothetical protein